MDFTIPTTIRETKVHFPNTRGVIISLLENMWKNGYPLPRASNEVIEGCFKKLEHLRTLILDFPNKSIHPLFSDTQVFCEESRDTLESTIAELSTRRNSPNEFYTVYDILTNKEVYKDPSMRTILGTDEIEFHRVLKAATLVGEKNPDSDDLFHAIRHALIHYLLLSIPGFKWKACEDHHLLRIRLSSQHIIGKKAQHSQYFSLEKRSYMLFHSNGMNAGIPRYHLHAYTVYPDMEEEYIFNKFISDKNQSIYMNAFTYLFNLYLIGIPPKYVLLLDEKQIHDRNKTVALGIQNKIKIATGLHVFMDDHHVADCFAKSIRSKVEDAFNFWDKRKKDNKVRIQSDAQSIHFAKKLGILPIPAKVKEMMYGLIGDENF
jgi:hypothetical protein